VAGKPKRARTARREQERDARKQERELRSAVRALETLAANGPGGSRERAIAVASSSVVEVKARATPCIQCGGELDLRHHAADVHGGTQYRTVALVCRRCHAPRTLWFRLGPGPAN
jgi:hypothetical protein